MEKVIDIRPIKKQMRSSCKEARRSMDKVIKANFDKKIQNKLLIVYLCPTVLHISLIMICPCGIICHESNPY